MDDYDFENTVIFELPAFEDVEAFVDRLRPRWEGWTHADEDLWLFTAHLDGGGELATLLREAQELVAELGLPAIRFCLDGRVYALEAAQAQRSAAA